MFALMLFLCVILHTMWSAVAMHVTLWYGVLIYHQYDVCKNCWQCVCWWVLWPELMISAIRYPLGSSVYECQRVECAFTSPVRTD